MHLILVYVGYKNMASLNGIVANLEHIDSKKNSLQKAILSLAVEWKDLGKHLDSTRSCVDAYVADLELKQKDLECKQESVAESSRELNEVRESLDLRLQELEHREENLRCCYQSQAEKLELKEKQLSQLQARIEERMGECETREEKISLQTKSMEVLSQNIEKEKAEVEDIRKSMGEKFKEICSKEKNYENLSKEVNLIQGRMESWAKKLGSKEEQLKELQKLNEERGNKLDISVRDCELKEERLRMEKKSLEDKLKNFEMEKEEFEGRKRSVDEMLSEINIKERNCKNKLREVNLIQDWTERRGREIYSIEEEFASKEEQLNARKKMNDKLSEELDVIKREYTSKEKRLEMEREEFQKIQISVDKKWEEIHMKEKNTEDRCEEVKLIQDQTERRPRELDLREEQLQEMEKMNKVCREDLDTFKKDLDTFEKECNLKEERLCIEKKSMDEQLVKIENEREMFEGSKRFVTDKLNEIGLKERSLEDRSKELKLIQDSIEKRARELDLEEQLLSMEKEKSEKEKEAIADSKKIIVEKLNDVSLKKKNYEDLSEKVKLMVDQIERRARELDSKEKQVALREEQLKSKLSKKRREEVDITLPKDRFRDSELKDKQFEEKSKDKLCIEKQFDNVKTDQVEEMPVIGLPTKIQDLVTMDGEYLQLYLCGHLKKHSSMPKDVCEILKSSSDPAKLVLEAMEWFYPPHLKKGDVGFEAGVIRMSCIILLEQLMLLSPQIGSCVSEAALSLAGEWKVKMEVHKDRMEVLGFVLLLACYKLASYFDANELLQHLEFLATRGLATATNLCRALNLSEKVPAIEDKVKTDQVEEMKIMGLPAEVLDLVTMNGVYLQLYMCEHYKKHSSLPKDVCEILKSSSDPAKLVLEAMEWFYKKWDVEFEAGVIRMSCNELLEQLMMLSPQIGSCVSEAALSLAGKWKVKMEVHKDYMEVLGFVQLLACYKLASYFDADELLQHLEYLAMRREAVELCRALDLSMKVPDLILSLITNNKHWVAVKFIVEFGLVEKFPPVPLLKDYYRISKKLHKDRQVMDENSVEALGNAFDEGIACIINIVNCIKSYKLESGDWNLVLEESKVAVQKNDDNNFFVPLTTAHIISKKNCFSHLLADMDGNNLLVFLNKHVDDHVHLRKEVSVAFRLSPDPAGIVLNAVQVFFLYLIKGGSNIEASVVRTCNLLLEELMKIQPDIRPQVKAAARDLAVEWRSITLKLTTTELTSGFLLFVSTYSLSSVFDSGELLKLYQTIGKHKLAPILCCFLGFSEQIPVSNNRDQFLQQSNTATAASGSNSHGSWNAIPDAIRHASDPAQLVLDTLEACYYSMLKHSNTSKSVLMMSFHFLLSRLMRVPLEVKSHTKEQAKKFAAHWKEKIGCCDSSEVSCLLLLLTTYKVLCSFPTVEVLSLLEIVYDDRATKTLFQSLRLSFEVPDFIGGLVERGEHLGAVKYLCAFGLVKRIPPLPILEDYIKGAKEEAQKIRERGQDSPDAQEMANKLELSAFKAAEDCVWLHELEAVYPIKNLKVQIEQMETQVPDLKETNKKRKLGEDFPNNEFPLEPCDSKKQQRAAAQMKPICPDTTFQSAAHPAGPMSSSGPMSDPYPVQVNIFKNTACLPKLRRACC